MIERVIVEADGGSRGNPGPAGYGALLRDPATGQILVERQEYLGTVTNNVAEYRGLIAGLLAAQDFGARAVDVRMDSKLVIEQTSGRWQVKHPDMKPLAREAIALLRQFDDRTLQWIPRAQNKDADRLANAAMDAGTGTATRSRLSPVGEAPPLPASWVPTSTAATRVLLVRHGSTPHSPQHRMSGRNPQPLSDVGRAQAGALAARLAGAVEQERDVVLVSSPLARTWETAEAIAATTGLPIVADDDLMELDFGDWEGCTPDEVREKWPTELTQWTAMTGDPRPPGGESVSELTRRVRRARDRMVAAQPDGLVIAVTHVTPIKTLVQTAIGAPASSMMRMFLTPASMTEIRYPDGGQPSLRSFNDRAHLERLPDY